jgi:protein-L-isoaspartate(D-aspartate) O-methyltransferase
MEDERRMLIRNLINEGYLKTPRIIKAFESVDRRFFVPKEHQDHAYADYPLPIGRGQTISAPHMVAIMTELLEPQKTDKVLEIGAGSGYQAAILSKLVNHIYTIELDPKLAEFARENLRRAGIENVKVIVGDGSEGYKKEAPYDKIILTCATDDFPKPLIDQLKEGGIIMGPLGGSFLQNLIVAKKVRGYLERKNYGGCVFVPLRH